MGEKKSLRRALGFLLCLAMAFALLGTGIVIPDNGIQVDASSSATSSSGGSSGGSGSSTTPVATGDYTYEKYSLPSGITGPKLLEVMNSTPLFYKDGDIYTQLLCYTYSNYAYYFYRSGNIYSNCDALGYGYDTLEIKNATVMNNLYKGIASSSGSSSGGSSSTTITSDVAQDGVYTAPVRVYKYKKGKLKKTYYGTVYVRVVDGKIYSIGVSGDDKVSKVVTSEVYHAYVGKEASVSVISQIDGVSSASISSDGGTGASDAVSSASVNTSKKKYYTTNLQDAILEAIRNAPKVEIPVETEETEPDAMYIGTVEVNDEEGSVITVNITTADGVIQDIKINEQGSVGTWFSMLGKMKDNYVGQTVDSVQSADAVTSATKYSPAFDEAVHTALSEEALPYDESVVAVSYSLSLKGDIAMNLYLKLGGKLIDEENGSVQFDLPGGNHTEENVSLKDAKYAVTFGSKCYGFSAGIAAKEMASTISATFIRDDNTTAGPFNTTVKSYCNYIINHPETAESAGYDDTTIVLAKAILNYGTYAQKSLGYNTGTLPVAEGKYSLPDVDLTSIADVTEEGSCTGLNYSATSAMLTTTTGLKHYFTLTGDGDVSRYTFTVNGEELTPVVNGSTASILISGIWADQLDEPIELTVENTEDHTSYKISYSVYNYVKKVLKSQKTSDDDKNMARAVYGYGEAAKTFFANH